MSAVPQERVAPLDLSALEKSLLMSLLAQLNERIRQAGAANLHLEGVAVGADFKCVFAITTAPFQDTPSTLQ
jgi:hypothetical protein